jgi:hypothetical protein
VTALDAEQEARLVAWQRFAYLLCKIQCIDVPLHSRIHATIASYRVQIAVFGAQSLVESMLRVK